MALVAFTSQSLGAAIMPIPCDMSGSNSTSMPVADMAVMDHSAHYAGTDGVGEVPGQNTSDCCGPDGNCAMGACVSVSLSPQSSLLSASRFVSLKPRLDVVSVTPPFMLSPYRPPIFH